MIDAARTVKLDSFAQAFEFVQNAMPDAEFYHRDEGDCVGFYTRVQHSDDVVFVEVGKPKYRLGEWCKATKVLVGVFV